MQIEWRSISVYKMLIETKTQTAQYQSEESVRNIVYILFQLS